ncbi:MAG: tetratricopeptide repeat protein [Planctomycetota bacterium]
MTQGPESQSAPAPHDVAVCLAVVLVALAVNLNAVWSLSPLGRPHGFVFDDYVLVVDEPAIQSLAPPSIVRIFTGTFRDAYRPLRVVSYAFDYAVWGLNPVGYHLTNILLHAANCALLFILIRLIGGDICWAGLAALLFTVHPAVSESVAGIAGRKDLLGASLALASFLSYVAAARSSRPYLFYLLSLICFALAFFAKEVMVAVLGPMAAYEICFERRQWLRNVLRRQIPFVLLTFSGFAFWRGMTSGHGTLSEQYGLPFAIKGLGSYLRLAFFPVRLSVDYNALPISDSFLDGGVLLSAFALAAIAVVAVVSLRKRPWLPFAVVWFFAMLFPLSNVLIPVGARLSERYLYAPLIGWCIAIGGVLTGLMSGAERVGPTLRQIVRTLAALLLVFFAIGAMARNRVWANDRTLWCDAIQNNYDSWLSQKGCGELYATYLKPIYPEWYRFATPHFLRSAAERPDTLASLVDVAILRNDWQRAEQFAREQTKRQPEHGPAWASLGKVYARQEKWKEAIEYYRKAVELSPWEACFWWDLGLIQSHMGEYGKALEYLHKASETNPSLQDRIAADIGGARLAMGSYSEAVPPLSKALASDPSNAKIAGLLALAYEQLGNYGEALAVCDQAMNTSPETHAALLPQRHLIQLKIALKESGPSADLLAQLGSIALMLGRTDAAVDYFEQAVGQDPRKAALRCFLANAFSAKQEFGKAEDQLRQAATLNPKDASVWAAYAVLHTAQGRTDEALDNLRKAVDIGGNPVREVARRLPQLQALHKDKRFWEIVGKPVPQDAEPKEQAPPGAAPPQ